MSVSGPGGLCRDRVRRPLFDRDPDRPNEAQELAPHGRHDLLLVLAPPEERPIAAMQSVLRFPGDRLHLVAERRLPFAERAAHGWAVPIRPRRLNDDASEVGIARLRNAAPACPPATGVLARAHPAIAHYLRGSRETGQLTDCGDDRHRRDQPDAPK